MLVNRPGEGKNLLNIIHHLLNRALLILFQTWALSVILKRSAPLGVGLLTSGSVFTFAVDGRPQCSAPLLCCVLSAPNATATAEKGQ